MNARQGGVTGAQYPVVKRGIDFVLSLCAVIVLSPVLLVIALAVKLDPARPHRLGCRCIETEVDRRGVNPKTDLKLLRFYVKLVVREKPDLVITYSIKPNICMGWAPPSSEKSRSRGHREVPYRAEKGAEGGL